MPSEVLSSRFVNEALSSGRAERHLPWPVEVLGVYGTNESTDADLDAYVEDETGLKPGAVLDLDETGGVPVRVSAFAGRPARGGPVVVVVLNRI